MNAICPCCGCGLFDHDGICEKAVERHLVIAKDEGQHRQLMAMIGKTWNHATWPERLDSV